MDREGSNNVAVDQGDNIPASSPRSENNHLSSIVTRQAIVSAHIAPLFSADTGGQGRDGK